LTMIKTDLEGTLSDLVSINSVNPAYELGQPEEQIQQYVRTFFKAQGFETFIQQVEPHRENVIARLPGREGVRPIIFEAHCDTAGVDGMDAPFRPAIRDGRMYGRGTCDTKACLAGMMWALADLKHSGSIPNYDVWVVSAVDEEHSCRGVLRLRENLRAHAAVVGEPTQMRMAVASKGCLRARITIRGRAAHSSKPELGVNAITQMARLLMEMELDNERLISRKHPLVGSPTLNVGLIEGGTQVNVVPADCAITFDRRLVPGEDPDAVAAEYYELLEKFQAANPELKAEMEEPMLKDWPLETPSNSPIVRCVGEVLESCGLNPEPYGVPFGSDASKLAQADISTIILGPGNIDDAHAAGEYVELAQLEQAFEVYRKIMTEFE
jgi:acetylornithine deacetylase/succinyl-diaminopimelate desuccinylase family protein